MGAALYIALEKEVPGIDSSSVNGKVLERAQAQLDGIARREGLTPLGDFISVDPNEAAAMFGDLGGVPAGVQLPCEQWFDPAEGLKTVQGLLGVVRREPSRLRNISVERVAADLEAAEKVLLAAAQRGVRFHLAIDC